jgi:hypothetical protein
MLFRKLKLELTSTGASNRKLHTSIDLWFPGVVGLAVRIIWALSALVLGLALRPSSCS